jgi:hypothetical protein
MLDGPRNVLAARQRAEPLEHSSSAVGIAGPAIIRGGQSHRFLLVAGLAKHPIRRAFSVAPSTGVQITRS